MFKKITEIIIDETIYTRTNFDPDTVERYREAMAAGTKFPPLVIKPDNRLLDGRHRLEAYMQIGREKAIEAGLTLERKNRLEKAFHDLREIVLNLSNAV